MARSRVAQRRARGPDYSTRRTPILAVEIVKFRPSGTLLAFSDWALAGRQAGAAPVGWPQPKLSRDRQGGLRRMNDQPKRTQFFGGCPHDCPDTCAMIYEVADGRLVEVRGNKEHPMTRGGLCVKLKDYHDHHYNP